MRFIAIIICLVYASAAIAAPGDLAQIKSQIKKTEQQQKQIEERVKVSERDIEKTKKDLVKTADKVSGLEEERGQVIKKISDLDSRQKNLNTQLSQNRERIANAAATILFIASNPNFDSENMREHILTSAVLSGAAQSFDAEIKTAMNQIAELEKIKNARAVEKEKLDRTAKKYAGEKKDLDKLLRIRAGQNDKLLAQQMSVQKKLRELSARAKNISELSAGVGSSQMSGDSKFSSRKLNAPVLGRLVVRYGDKTGMGFESDGWRINSRSGAIVVAPADGTVKFADSFKGFGRIIIMSHKNGYNTVMTNLGQLNVLIGQDVLAGEPIGRMDAEKSEMYLEVRRGKNAVDPARLFREP